jgi:hypothetical protein
MNSPPADNAALPRWMRSWERFWFTPMDPTLLGLIRILCGAIVVYTFAVYSFSLQDMMGQDAWVDLTLRQELAWDRPILASPLLGTPTVKPPQTEQQRKWLDEFREETGMDLRVFGLRPPETEYEWRYLKAYYADFKQIPPAYVKTDDEARAVWEYHKAFHMDPRILGLKMPESKWEAEYLLRYSKNWGQPPPAYAATPEEADAIDEYRARMHIDPRILYARGTPIWSVWMHITEPTAMAWVQASFVLAALLFTLGIGTRVTSVLTWFASLQYIHRNSQVLFGADTMINILLLYLMIGPSGAALSLDRLIARWWRGSAPTPPVPRVSANVAIRLLQIHVCIIYLMAGVSKLQGQAWWNGSALWFVIGNFEFAPMQFSLYNDLLRFIGRNEILFQFLMLSGCYFTLVFEVGYAFLIWFPRTRWLYLAGAIMLHGLIGMFMGLKTFSFIMLVMNMAFLRTDEVYWLLRWFRRPAATRPAAPVLQTAGK